MRVNNFPGFFIESGLECEERKARKTWIFVFAYRLFLPPLGTRSSFSALYTLQAPSPFYSCTLNHWRRLFVGPLWRRPPFTILNLAWPSSKESDYYMKTSSAYGRGLQLTLNCEIATAVLELCSNAISHSQPQRVWRAETPSTESLEAIPCDGSGDALNGQHQRCCHLSHPQHNRLGWLYKGRLSSTLETLLWKSQGPETKNNRLLSCMFGALTIGQH